MYKFDEIIILLNLNLKTNLKLVYQFLLKIIKSIN